ncbi:50S ribosomal protein L4 [Penicillium hetheringtonii]|uniref:Large ribosomal subunit protein uL4m n=1 Tax=Penicillium hetheringtonii TaxID=911720 RepID=A0AAD6GN38_9EURO|nr:50S ribosomal protein L4 [Penicillium hetheringtonii]
MPGSEAFRDAEIALTHIKWPSRGRRCFARSMATEAQANTSSTSSPLAPWDAPGPKSWLTPFLPWSPPASWNTPRNNYKCQSGKIFYTYQVEGEVHGSQRKLMPQKGSGRARVGNKQSPIRVGGGVARGPHPRDFSTGLPAKIYDQAWRIALSYRFSRGELIVMTTKLRYLPILHRSLNFDHSRFRRAIVFDTMDKLRRYATLKDCSEVDVKNLLETERLIIEKKALDRFLKWHSRDLNNKPAKARYLDL